MGPETEMQTTEDQENFSQLERLAEKPETNREKELRIANEYKRMHDLALKYPGMSLEEAKKIEEEKKAELQKLKNQIPPDYRKNYDQNPKKYTVNNER